MPIIYEKQRHEITAHALELCSQINELEHARNKRDVLQDALNKNEIKHYLGIIEMKDEYTEQDKAHTEKILKALQELGNIYKTLLDQDKESHD